MAMAAASFAAAGASGTPSLSSIAFVPLGQSRLPFGVCRATAAQLVSRSAVADDRVAHDDAAIASPVAASVAATVTKVATKKGKASRRRVSAARRRPSLADLAAKLKERAAAEASLAKSRSEVREELVGRIVGGAERHGEILVEPLPGDAVAPDAPTTVATTGADTVELSSSGTECEEVLSTPASAGDVDDGGGTASLSSTDCPEDDEEPDGPEMLICEIPRGSRAPDPPPIVGDFVRMERSPHAAGMADGVLLEVLPRRTTLLRRHPAIPQKSQALCANLDLAVLVVSVAPNFSEGMVDRVLVSAHKQGFEAAIVLNKVDLIPEGTEERAAVDDRLAVYEQIGIKVLRTSTLTGEGVDDLRKLLAGRTSILIGNSGVGKSHLLNVLGQGQIEVRVGEISERLKLGRHTTTTSTLHRLPGTGAEALLIDSPGARRFSIWDVEAKELKDHWVEFLAHADNCRFGNCNHLGEPGCAVAAAVREGIIPQQRLDSYMRIRSELLQGREGIKVYGGMQMAGSRAK